MVADGNTVWADVVSMGAHAKLSGGLWRFDGASQRVTFHVSDRGLVTSDLVGNAVLGLWCTVNLAAPGKAALTFGQWSSGRWDEVMHVNPATGVASVVAEVHPETIPGDFASLAPVIYKGTLYLFDAPFSVNGQFRSAYVYRLTS